MPAHISHALFASLGMPCLERIVAKFPAVSSRVLWPLRDVSATELVRLDCPELWKLKHKVTGSSDADMDLIHIASWCDHPKIMEALIQVLKPTVSSNEITSAMSVAALNGSVEVVEVLHRFGVAVSDDVLESLISSGAPRALTLAKRLDNGNLKPWRAAVLRCIESGDDDLVARIHEERPAVCSLGAIAVGILWFGRPEKMPGCVSMTRKTRYSAEERRLLAGHPGIMTKYFSLGSIRFARCVPTTAPIRYALRTFGVPPASASLEDVLDDLRAEGDREGMDEVHRLWKISADK